MDNQVFIYGLSGSGKSTAIRTLPPENTFIIRSIDKELPFQDADKYTVETTDNYVAIDKLIDQIKDDKRRKFLVLDDTQYLIINQFMRFHNHSDNKGNAVFSFYNKIADNFWNLVLKTKSLRKDLTVFFLHHAERNDEGFLKPKTIGKILDDKVEICGMFTTVLLAMRSGSENSFLTQNDGSHQAKSPCGMFNKVDIKNDLLFVYEQISNYYSKRGSVQNGETF